MAVLAVCFLFTASDSWATNEVTVKLNSWTSPSAGLAGQTYVNLTVSGMPAGTIDPNAVVITLSPTCGGAPSATTNASSVKHILGTSDRFDFQVPGAIPATGNYFVSILGSSGSIQFSSGSSCSEIAVSVGPNTLVVTNLNDSGPGSLRATLAAAGDGDTITFASGLAGTIELTSGELPITHSVNVDGPAARLITVSGNNTSRVFEVVAGFNVTIDDLTISDGNGLNQGGGILNDGSNLTLNRAVVWQNIATASPTSNAQGGGILSLGGTVTVTGCQFAGNQAIGSPSGGAFGGGIAVTGGSLTLTNSTLTGNMVTGASGGNAYGAGVFIGSEPGGNAVQGNFIGTNVNGNSAQGGNAYGAGVFIGSEPGGNTVQGNFIGSNVMGNSAQGGNASGGGIYVTGGTLTLTYSTLSGNLAAGGSGGNADGGGIFNTQSATTTVSNSIITQNQAIGGAGSAGLGGGVYNDTNSTLTLNEASVTQNNAQGSPGVGGGIYTLGTFVFDFSTVIASNEASTSNPNIGP